MHTSLSRAVAAAALVLALASCGRKDVATVGTGNDRLIVSELDGSQLAEASLATAREYDANGLTEDAIRQYETARAANPKLRGISHRLMILYGQTGDERATDEEFQKALKETPRNADLENDYGFFQQSLGRVDRAREQYTKAVLIDPKNRLAWSNLARLEAEERNYDAALSAWSNVVSEAESHSNLGIYQAKNGDVEEAKRSLERALELNRTLQAPREVLRWLEEGGAERVREALAEGETGAAPAGAGHLAS
ncbi:MAG: tetratricopeptide repeat protein [Candidatus Sumerlaeia bacterium]|nr:tetratricopeptide repeat protein [Candidatus Sumerlaeia bacterium]